MFVFKEEVDGRLERIIPCVTSAPEWRGMLGIAAHSSHIPGFASLATLQDAF